jgi:NADPH-dependent 2,4-dienoyl-CoA reductase/sulfur reductase-like enzyme/rhodanese-related sulfurtransferase
MPKHNRIVLIGGTACGPKAAARARRLDPTAKITVVEQRGNLSTATCGLPYFISGVIKDEGDMIARETDYFRDVFDMEVLTHTKAQSINTKAHSIDTIDLYTDNKKTIEYDKLVIATGSTPIVPDWPGKDLDGVFTLTGLPDASAIRSYVKQLDNREVVIIGAGLIGLEMAENFITLGCNVTVIEALDWLLPKLLDFEVAAYVQKHLQDHGVKMLFGQRVTALGGDPGGKVSKVITENGEVAASLVLLSLGIRPNVGIAREAGLAIGSTGGIAVNQYLQTSDPDIYAGGDCVENTHLITGEKALVPLGSTANKHGRIIGTNLTGGSDTFPGVLGTAIAKVFEYNAGRVGLTESEARQHGHNVVTSLVPGPEYASYYPGGQQILVKLVAEESSGKLLGCQVVGPGEAAKRIDVLATALTLGANLDNLSNLDLAYAPPYNSAMDPLHHAANLILNKRDELARTVTPMDVKTKLDNDDKFVLLDVRGEDEWKLQHFDTPQSLLLPMPELRKRLDELSRDDEIIIFCHTSVRAYQAQRILDGAGFKTVKFMEGSLSAWPYEDYLS